MGVVPLFWEGGGGKHAFDFAPTIRVTDYKLARWRSFLIKKRLVIEIISSVVITSAELPTGNGENVERER